MFEIIINVLIFCVIVRLTMGTLQLIIGMFDHATRKNEPSLDDHQAFWAAQHPDDRPAFLDGKRVNYDLDP